MKQHITLDQINELNEKSKQKLQSWWDKNYKEETLSDYEMQYGYDPILSIGQMIEFLDKKVYQIAFQDNGFTLRDRKFNIISKNNNLCDALWSACKDILNETM